MEEEKIEVDEEKTEKPEYYMDPIMGRELDKVREAVIKKDRDYVMVVDGEEGSGKSVLAMQIAKHLDPTFNIENIVFTADQFMKKIKITKKFACIVLDEAFSASSARASLSQVNRAMLGIATEMRQRNLFIIMCIPSFFDLDKYFALWRCKALIHVYFRKDGSRGRYILFPKTKKKYLYLNGKKNYNYSKPKSPFPPLVFSNHYVVDETAYRQHKANAFKTRTVSNMARKWKEQRDALIKELYHNFRVSSADMGIKLEEWGAKPLSSREIRRLVQLS